MRGIARDLEDELPASPGPDEAGRRVRVTVATRGVLGSLAGVVAALLWALGDPPLERNLAVPGNGGDGHLPANVTSLAFASGGRMLASTGSEGSLRFWDATTGRLDATIPWKRAAAVVSSPDGETLAVTDWSPTVTLLDPGSGEVLRMLTPEGEAACAVQVAAFSPDGRALAVAYVDGSIRAWDTGRARAALLAGSGEPVALALAYSPDGRTLAAGDTAGRIRLRDAANGLERAACRAHTRQVLALAFSPGGETLASGGTFDPVAREWDAATLRPVRALEGHATSVTHAAYSPDGRTLATAGGRGTIALWDAATGRRRWTRRVHDGWILALAFSPDGGLLATGGGEGAIKLRCVEGRGGGGLGTR